MDTCRVVSFVGTQHYIQYALYHYLLCLLGGGSAWHIRKHVRTNDTSIDGLSAHSLRMVQPKNKSCLGHVIEWDETDNESSHAFNNAKEGKYDPVGKPLCVLSVILVHGLEGHVSRVDKSNQIDNELGPTQQSQESRKNSADGKEKINLAKTSFFFELLELVCYLDCVCMWSVEAIIEEVVVSLQYCVLDHNVISFGCSKK